MKILVISQHIFPMQSPRALRTTELIKELSRRGHEVTVYAVLGKCDYSFFEKEFNIKIKSIPISFQVHPYNSDNDKKRTLIDKVLGKLLGRKFEFPDIEFLFSIPKIIKKEQNSDVLITVAHPHPIHWGAAKAKKKLKNKFPKVWIADSGDPYTNNGKNKKPKYLESLEQFSLSTCDYFTVPFEDAKLGYNPNYRSKIKVIPQGFDFDMTMKDKRKDPDNKVVTFAYAGMFYEDIRNPSKLLEYLSSVNIHFRFIIYTPFSDLVDKFRDKLGDKLMVNNVIPRKELLNKLSEMDFVINLDNQDIITQIPSKLIDYAIVGVPILSLKPNEIDKDLINRFLHKDYSKRLEIENIQQYHITSVVSAFEKLIV